MTIVIWIVTIISVLGSVELLARAAATKEATVTGRDRPEVS